MRDDEINAYVRDDRIYRKQKHSLLCVINIYLYIRFGIIFYIETAALRSFERVRYELCFIRRYRIFSELNNGQI